jgi:hypothetical protein
MHRESEIQFEVPGLGFEETALAAVDFVGFPTRIELEFGAMSLAVDAVPSHVSIGVRSFRPDPRDPEGQPGESISVVLDGDGDNVLIVRRRDFANGVEVNPQFHLVIESHAGGRISFHRMISEDRSAFGGWVT